MGKPHPRVFGYRPPSFFSSFSVVYFRDVGHLINGWVGAHAKLKLKAPSNSLFSRLAFPRQTPKNAFEQLPIPISYKARWNTHMPISEGRERKRDAYKSKNQVKICIRCMSRSWGRRSDSLLIIGIPWLDHQHLIESNLD